jgi:hypothetical protein
MQRRTPERHVVSSLVQSSHEVVHHFQGGKMFRKHLTRLSVMVVTGSFVIAMYADLALAGRGAP